MSQAPSPSSLPSAEDVMVEFELALYNKFGNTFASDQMHRLHLLAEKVAALSRRCAELEQYADHKIDCALFFPELEQKCTCGLEAIQRTTAQDEVK